MVQNVLEVQEDILVTAAKMSNSCYLSMIYNTAEKQLPRKCFVSFAFFYQRKSVLKGDKIRGSIVLHRKILPEKTFVQIFISQAKMSKSKQFVPSATRNRTDEGCMIYYRISIHSLQIFCSLALTSRTHQHKT